MCGIVGVLGDSHDLKRGMEAIRHRGPDASGIWKAPDGETPASIGHQRLSIIDLSENANQPFTSHDGRHVLVFNGEIYNYIELRKELQDQGVIFFTNSDTEVFLNGLILYGDDFLLKCNGMWAFCLWDRKLSKALLGRDRFGKKPLFFSFVGKALYFASEMKAIFPYLDGVNLVEDVDIFLANIFDYEHTEKCIVSGINRLKPGHIATWTTQSMRIKRWWNTLDHLVDVPKKYGDQVEQWRDLFLDSVRLRMRSDVPIGTALSGGLDSSAIAAAVNFQRRGHPEAIQQPKIQKAFCAHYPNSSLDEYKWAAKFADSINLPLEKVEINPKRFPDRLSEMLAYMEDPYISSPLPMLATYRTISQQGIMVTLDGHGADELFSGYGHLNTLLNMTNLIESQEILKIIKSTQTGRLDAITHPENLGLLLSRAFKFLMPFDSKARRYVKYMLGRIPRKLLNYKLTFEDQNHPAFKSMDPFNRQLYEIFHVSTLPTLLRNYDRYSMASGVEIRMPFLDWRLVCFTFSLPWESKVGNGYTKRLLRDALKGILPDEIRLRRDKIGWNAPFHEWARNENRAEIQALVEEKNCPANLKKAWQRFNKISEPNFNDGQKLWSQIMPEIWKKSLLESANS
jgi:asparagine synthase (glutamine-hydrolysing)